MRQINVFSSPTRQLQYRTSLPPSDSHRRTEYLLDHVGEVNMFPLPARHVLVKLGQWPYDTVCTTQASLLHNKLANNRYATSV